MIYNLDGEIRAISSDYAGAARKYRESVFVKEHKQEIEKINYELKCKFINFIYNDKERCIKLLKYFFGNCDHLTEIEFEDLSFSLIHREPTLIDTFNEFGTIALKFKRSENDGLGETLV